MITVDQMVRVTRKGGAVTHLALTSGVSSVCGRVALFGPAVPEARLCKTCARIARVADSEGQWTEAEQAFISLPRESGVWEMLADVVSDYENGGENDPHRIALYRAALAQRNYATTVITNHSDVRMPRGNGNTMGYGKEKRTNSASEKQIQFIQSMYEVTDQAYGQGMLEIFNELVAEGSVDKKKASSIIEKLIPKYREAKDVIAKARISENTKAVQSSGIEKDEIFVFEGEYYKTKASKAGHLYAMRWDGERWDYDSAKGVIRKLTPEMRATAEQASEFGHTYHCCVYCSRGLNDSRSETVGYGPICADKYGLPWGE